MRCFYTFEIIEEKKMIIEISVAVIALAFVALVIYLINVLSSLRRTLDQARFTLQGINELKGDLDDKSKCLDPIFLTCSILGEKALDKVKNMPAKELENVKEDKFTNILEWITEGIRLWCTIKKGR